jgi:hypothetical protein
MPEGFRNPGEPADLWTPARPSRTGEGGGDNYGVIGRLRDGHTRTDAYAELARLGDASFKSRSFTLKEGESFWF